MTRFTRHIRPFVEAELNAARDCRGRGDSTAEFSHLETAHVLGQASTRWHVRVHLEMLRWGIRQQRPREILGQCLRIVGAATKTAFGWVPRGNTGGSNISPFRPLPIRPELEAIIQRARDDC